jgi:hypothetical protein
MVDMHVGILFCFFFIPFKLYFLWVNYKGRFTYRLWESSSFWRTLDKKIGVFSLVLDFVLSALIVLIFAVPTKIALAFVLFGAIGWTSVNMAVDKINVERFEKNCLQCKYKQECMDFHHEKCSSEGGKTTLKECNSIRKNKQAKRRVLIKRIPNGLQAYLVFCPFP